MKERQRESEDGGEKRGGEEGMRGVNKEEDEKGGLTRRYRGERRKKEMREVKER